MYACTVCMYALQCHTCSNYILFSCLFFILMYYTLHSYWRSVCVQGFVPVPGIQYQYPTVPFFVLYCLCNNKNVISVVKNKVVDIQQMDMDGYGGTSAFRKEAVQKLGSSWRDCFFSLRTFLIFSTWITGLELINLWNISAVLD